MGLLPNVGFHILTAVRRDFTRVRPVVWCLWKSSIALESVTQKTISSKATRHATQHDKSYKQKANRRGTSISVLQDGSSAGSRIKRDHLVSDPIFEWLKEISMLRVDHFGFSKFISKCTKKLTASGWQNIPEHRLMELLEKFLLRVETELRTNRLPITCCISVVYQLSRWPLCTRKQLIDRVAPNFWSLWFREVSRECNKLEARYFANIVAALERFDNKLVVPDEFWQSLFEALNNSLTSGRFKSDAVAQSYSILIWALGKLATRGQFAVSCIDQQQFDSIMKQWETGSLAVLKSFSPQNISNCFHGLASLQLRPSEKWLSSVLLFSEGLLPSFYQQELSNTAWALGKLSENGSLPKTRKFEIQLKCFLNALETECVRKMKIFSEQGLSNLPYGLALANANLSKEFYTAWEDSAVSKIYQFNAQALNNAIYAFACLGRPPGTVFLENWFAVCTERVFEFNEQALSNTMYSLGVLRVDVPNRFLRNWEEASICKIKKFTVQGLSNALYGLACIGCIPGKEFLAAWFEAAYIKLPQFTQQELANIIYSFGILRLTVPDKFLKLWEEAALLRLNAFSAQALTNSLYGLACLGRLPSGKFLDVWLKVSRKKLAEFTEQALANCALALCKLDCPVPDFLWQKVVNRTGQMTVQAVANLFYCLVVHRLIFKSDPEQLISIQAALSGRMKDIDVCQLPLEELRQIYQYLLVFKDGIQNNSLDSLDISTCTVRLKEHLVQDISKLQRCARDTLCLLLPEFGLNSDIIKDEWFLEECGSAVDIFVPFAGLVIQVDGPSHYILDAEGKIIEKIKTRLNTALLEKGGYKVVRVSYLIIDQGKEHLNNYLRKFVLPFLLQKRT